PRVEAGGGSPMDVDNYHNSAPSIIHWQGSSSHVSGPSGTPADATLGSLQGSRPSFWSRLVQQHPAVQGGAQRHQLVARPSPVVDRAVLPSTDPGSGSFYGRFRLGLGHCPPQQGDFSPLVASGIPTVNQLAGAQDSSTCRPPPRGPEEGDSDPLGQHDDPGLRDQVWRHSLNPSHGSGTPDLDSLSTDRNEDYDIVHQVRGQSSGSPISSPLAPDGMDTELESIPPDRQDVGPAHSGPICIEDQHSAST
ncbi:hypothetical protein BG015_006493, partial [Linnemannia schmuckeri]